MRSGKLYLALLSLITLFISPLEVNAQQFIFKPRHLVGNKVSIGDVHTGGFPYTIHISDPLFSGYNTATTQIKSVHDFVKFYVDHDTNTLADDYHYQADVTINGYAPGSSTVSYTKTDTLTISYSKGAMGSTFHPAYYDKDIRKFSNFHKIELVINDVYVLHGNGTPPASISTFSSSTLPGYNCYFSVEIALQDYDKSNYGGSYPVSQLSSSYLSSENALQVNFWGSNPLVPAMYELEWTYIDNYDYDISTNTIGSKTTSQLTYDFKNNATRIITDKPFYKIPIVYEKGYVVFRVRLIRPDQTDYTVPIYTDWSITNTTGLISSLSTPSSRYYYQITQSHLDDSLNWQYTTTYAEEGKYKQVMNYFDGSLKPRQTITRFNSNPANLLVTENIYDFKGRPAITILPTPVKNSGFRYVYDVSLNSATNDPYKSADFDTLQPANTCPSEFSLTPLHTDALANKYYSPANTDTSNFQKFVPDAEGYPMVHTIFSPEDDKKVLKQGGAGDVLQMGNGHITQYEYVEPVQSELNRLFGTEIGYSEYYNKAVVTDPNGQSAYEITDYEGRKVATAMLGLGPDSSQHPIVPLVTSDTSTILEDLLDGESQTPVNYTWSLSKSHYVETSGDHMMQYIVKVPPYKVCGGNKYLTVGAEYYYEMFDRCGNLDTSKGETLGYTGMINPPPGTGQNTGATITKWLDKGTHTINKTLTIRFDSITAAVDTFMAQAVSLNCINSEDYFIKKAVLEKQFPCPVDTFDPCQQAINEMMAELFPGKKYGKYYKKANGAFDSSAYLTMSALNSVFDLWAGSPSKLRFRSCTSLAWPSSVVYQGKTYINIPTLPVDTFIKIFDTSMARALLPLHPEYCKRCNAAEEYYPELLKSVPDYEMAIQLGYFSLDDIINNDPFYQFFAGYYDSLATIRTINKRIDSLCIYLAYCAGVDSTQSRTCLDGIYSNLFTAGTYDITNAPPLIKEAYWKRLIPMYVANREMVIKYMQAYDTDVECNPCTATRMTLTGDGIYGPYIVSTTPSLISDSTVINQLFTNSTTGISIPSWIANALSGNADSTAIDSTYALYAQYQLSLCDTVASQMARSLINCSTNPSDIDELRDSLRNYYCLGPGIGMPYEPSVIRRIILNCGLSLTDICNPYLVNYNPFPSPSKDFGALTCRSNEFYEDAKDFFNTAAIQSSITNMGLSYPTLSTGNLNEFENEIIGELGSGTVTASTTYDAVLKTYNTQIQNSGGNTINFWLKKLDQAGDCGLSLDQYDSWQVQEVVCLKDAMTNIFPAMINKNTFVAKIQGVIGVDTFICRSLVWSDSITVMDEQAIDKSICIACPEIKKVYKDFKDTMNTYGVCCTDHPYYSWMFSNYLDEALGKQYSVQQVEDFIASCALADTIEFRLLYGQFSLTNMSNTSVANLLSGLTSLCGSTTPYFKYKISGNTDNNLLIWFNSIPTNKLLAAKQYVLSNYAANSPVYGSSASLGVVAEVFIPTQLSPPSLPGSTGISGNSTPSDNVTVYLNSNPANAGLSYQRYTITYSGLQPYQLLQYTRTLNDYVYNNIPGARIIAAYDPFVNGDYDLVEKKDFLSYNYSLPTNLKHHELVKKLHEDTLVVKVYNSGANASGTNYNSPSVTYTSPYLGSDYSNLFVTANGQSSNPNFLLANEMLLEFANVHSSKIFFNASTTSVTPSAFTGTQIGATDRLEVFRCGDGRTYWYRLFKAGTHKLYNLYVKVPDYIQNANQLGFQSITLGNGDGNVFRVKVNLTLPGGSNTIQAYGYTDFSVGTGTRLENSLLCRGMYDEWNIPDTMTCERHLLTVAINEGKQQFLLYKDSVRNALIAGFTQHLYDSVCEQFFLRTRDQKYHFTLYYYDRAGNLEKVIPPAGVNRLDTVASATASLHRNANTVSNATLPQHIKETRYKYNSLNKVTEELSVDGGITRYFYDAVGRVVFSQTAYQKSISRVGYVLYDEQGRVIETGQGPFTCAPLCDDCGGEPMAQVTNAPNMSLAQLRSFILSRPREEVVATKYDVEAKNLDQEEGMNRQTFLRKRVAALKYFENIKANDRGDLSNYYDFATHYSYDMGGNTKTLTHEFVNIPLAKHRFKRVDYDYDMLSGKVNMLSYSRGFSDQYYHRFSYDEDNRITKAETSNDGISWDIDAEYEYYEHGPLARQRIGDLHVQAQDYAYTIQGWLKAMNSDMADSTLDMGGDGLLPNSIIPNDVFSYSLNYFNGDYKPIAQTPVTNTVDVGKSLYNGNIARQTTSIKFNNELVKEYKYDPLNRLKSTHYYDIDRNSNNDLVPTDAYRNHYSYDEDGNLTDLVRMGPLVSGVAQLMDSLNYIKSTVYDPNSNSIGDIQDFAANTNAIEDLPYWLNNGNDRMSYDPSGRLTSDAINATTGIKWSMYNKQKAANTQHADMHFYYDGAGNRIQESSRAWNGSSNFVKSHDFYARDASGNILAIMKYREYMRGEWRSILAEVSIDDLSIPVITLGTLYQHNGNYISNIVKGTLGVEGLSGSMLLAKSGRFYFEQEPWVYLRPCKMPYVTVWVDDLRSGDDTKPIIGNSVKQNAMTQLMKHITRNSETMYLAGTDWKDSAPDDFQVLCNNLGIPPEPEEFQNMFVNEPELVTNTVRLHLLENSVVEVFDNLLSLWLGNVDLTPPDGDESADKFRDEIWESLYTYIQDENNAADRETVIDVISERPDIVEELRSNFGDELMLHHLYESDPSEYLTTYLEISAGEMSSAGIERLTAAWEDMPGMTVAKLVQDLDQYADANHLSYYHEWALGESFELAEHHLYGSKRLGIKYYGLDKRWSWNDSTGYLVPVYSILNLRTPWYSRSLGDYIKPQIALNPPATFSWAAQADYGEWFSHRMLGAKRYELTDYLGNVQSVIMDRHTPIPDVGADTIKKFEADIHLAMDYYPYGMPMTMSYCDTCLIDGGDPIGNNPGASALYRGWSNTDISPTSYPPQTNTIRIGNWNITAPEEGWATMYWDGTGTGMLLRNDKPVEPNTIEAAIVGATETDPETEYTINIDIAENTMGTVTAKVIYYTDEEHVSYDVLNYTEFDLGAGSGGINFTAPGDSVWLMIGRKFEDGIADEGSLLRIAAASMDKYNWTVSQVSLLSLIMQINNPYRFAYNGQERIDEKAGRANHYTAQFWEYDPRKAIRENQDPKTAYGWSPYAVFGNNPIWYNDPLGDEVKPTTPAAEAALKKYGEKTYVNSRGKEKKNDNYEPAFGEVYDKWKNDDNVLVEFTTGSGDGTIGYSGKNEKGQDVYKVFWDPSQDERLGASGIFEESFHLKEAMDGTEMKFAKNSGGDETGYGVAGLDIYDEVRAKQWVGNNIKSFRETYSLGSNFFGYTHYGYIKKLNNKDLIKNALMNGVGSQQPIYKIGLNNTGTSFGTSTIITSYELSNFGGKYSTFSPTEQKP